MKSYARIDDLGGESFFGSDFEAGTIRTSGFRFLRFAGYDKKNLAYIKQDK